MQPRQIVELVRKGFAVATAERAQLMRSCLDVEVVDDTWVPRWALEAESALEAAGYGADRIADLFAAGRGAVIAELQALVRTGRRTRVLEPRPAFAPLSFDRSTKSMLFSSLQEHRAACVTCRPGPCEEARELLDEIELLFPHDRRTHPRS